MTLSTSSMLKQTIEGKIPESVTLRELKDLLHERGFGLLMLIFSLPIAIPFPYPPGFTTVVGAPLLLFSLQMMLGMDSPWLPNRIGRITIKRETLSVVINKSIPYLQKIEHFLKPRLESLSGKTGERLIGLISCLCALSIALPIPLGNALPALGILLMALGLLNKDGIVIIAGTIASILGIALAAAVVTLGVGGVKQLLGW